MQCRAAVRPNRFGYLHLDAGTSWADSIAAQG